jgi:hypothetical protein
MKQTLTRIFHLAIAVLIGGLAMTVWIQHRELTTPIHQQELWDPTDGWKRAPMPTFKAPASPSSLFTPPPYVGPGAH